MHFCDDLYFVVPLTVLNTCTCLQFLLHVLSTQIHGIEDTTFTSLLSKADIVN